MILETVNLNYSINEHEILKNVNLCFEEGKFYGILGPNGAGKSTFIDIISAIKNNYKGKVFLNGKNIKELHLKEVAKMISLVPQNFYLDFPFSIKEILLMGRHPHKKFLKGYSEEDYLMVDKIYNKFNFNLLNNNSVMELSGGEKQRVFFAKALVQDTPIVLLDESTSNLDIYYTHMLLKDMKNLVKTQNKTVISIFHDINCAINYCDELIFMKNGQIITKGPLSETINEDNLFNLYNMNFKIFKNKNKLISIIPEEENLYEKI
ncbi:ABC transporter ATP-binding protein [Oceanotoga sp. DSM 15011]|uniref:ABC transporter ATP-binding protein n=1 Tax=Oceanotoga sp. DSM 15011 TaxID=2984951 RepID=UPI0021F3F04C|nr:ABC transporter ATP-binding protein [Oceanotoga sp. DSM 15011]UYP00161.1 ABC transporter ATP-binding protein [Oceanotoga sp. DSM 15011]